MCSISESHEWVAGGRTTGPYRLCVLTSEGPYWLLSGEILGYAWCAFA